MLKNYDVVLIRHAESLFNEATWRVAKQLELYKSWDDLIQDEKFNELVTYNEKYMDPVLSPQGRNQCVKYKLECDKIKPDVILVSPYKRALETCHRLFHDSSAPVIVQPVLAQVFRFACDVPVSIQQNKKAFPNYDFTRVEKHGDNWYLQNLVPQYKNNIQNLIHKQKITNHNERNLRLLQKLKNKQISEEPTMLRKRAKQIKKLLSQYKNKHEKIVVIAHYYLIQFLKAKGFDSDGDLIQYQDIRNCHPYYENLSQLLKIQ